MPKTQSTRIKTVPAMAPGLSLEDAVAQIQESFSAPPEAQELNVSQPSDSATPVVAAPASEPVRPPAKVDELPRPVVTEAEPKPSIRPGLYRLDAEGYAEPVPEEDALKFERLNADYTTKTQVLAEERRQFYAEQAALKAEREQLVIEKARTAAALKAALPPEPDWNQEYAADPVNFAAKYAAYDIRQKQTQRAEQEAQAEQQKLTAQRQATERARLLEFIPEWQNAETRQREMGELSQYITAQQWDPPVVNAVLNDSRALRLARIAMIAERKSPQAEAQRQATQIKIDRVKVAPPGAAAQLKPGPTLLQQKQRRLQQTGKLSDATEVLRELWK